jgi:hypothetical protein
MILRLIVATAILLLAGYVDALAATSKPAGHMQASSAAAGEQTKVLKVEQKKPRLPDDYTLNMMIRSTIIAVNQANKSGNYSVLRDLGSPAFQRANSVAKLAEIFAAQRNAKLDFSPVLFFKPNLVAKPEVDTNGILRLTGFFPTQPVIISFDLAFEWVDNEWQHTGVSVSTRRAPETAGANAVAH